MHQMLSGSTHIHRVENFGPGENWKPRNNFGLQMHQMLSGSTYIHRVENFGSRAGEERLKNWKPRNKFVLPMLLAAMSICFKCDFSKCGSRPVGERWEWEGPISLIQPEAFEFLGLEFF